MAVQVFVCIAVVMLLSMWFEFVCARWHVLLLGADLFCCVVCCCDMLCGVYVMMPTPVCVPVSAG